MTFFLPEFKHLRLGVGRALCLDKVGHDDGEANAHVEIVLHDEVFLDGANLEDWKMKVEREIILEMMESTIRQYLGSKEGGDSEESHVGTSHTSLGVEGVEPLSREDQRLHGSPLNGPLTK